MNRLSSSTDPLSRTESYQYDLNGNLTRKTKRDGASIDYLYDPANQLVQKTSSSAHPEPVEGPNITTYTYDLNGNLTGVADPDSSLSFAYDPLDRVIRTQSSVLGAQSSPVIDYTHDAVGNRLSMTQLAPDPSPLTTTYSYDAMNRLIELRNPQSELWQFSYDLAGRRTGLTYPNGIATTYAHDASSRLLSLHHDQSGTPVAHFDYAYDPVGNRTQKGELDGSTGYSYDPLNRLISASTTVPGLPQEFYSYDAVGNRITSYLASSHTHDAANQLLEDQQFFYSYDPNGNQTGKTAKDGSERWVYTYDAENQLVSVLRFAPATATTPAMTASYVYDGLGRRVAKTVNAATTTYVYDNEDIVSFNGSKVTHGPGIDEPLKVADVALLQDALGSVIGEVSASGTSRLNYESFGTTDSPPTTPYGFTSRELDQETALHLFRTRYFDPTEGRFTQSDRLSFSSVEVIRSILKNETQGRLAGLVKDQLMIQRIGYTDFSYPTCNPVDRNDPAGLVDLGKVGQAVGAAATRLLGTLSPIPLSALNPDPAVKTLLKGGPASHLTSIFYPPSPLGVADFTTDTDGDGFPDVFDPDPLKPEPTDAFS